MNSTTPIFLKPGWTVNIDGVELSYEEEIKEAKIDSILYRKHLKELMAKAESQ